ncbi:MAG TPA: hypothetical protein VLA17_06545 [Candidatus Limnocylindria bacterium]|nr:hypothetical protein [Candidatus Limnocylindria bacterium]
MTDLTEYTKSAWQPARHVWPIVAAACLGLAIAMAAWFAVSVWEDRLAKAKFTAIAHDYATVLQTGFDDYLGKLLAVRAFYDASHEVDSVEFAVFTDQITRGYDDTMRLVWAPRVTRDERSSNAKRQRPVSAAFTSEPGRRPIRWRSRPLATSISQFSSRRLPPNARQHSAPI